MRALSSVLLCALFCWSAVAVSRVASESDSDTDFLSDRQAQELDSIRQESELHANGEDQFMVRYILQKEDVIPHLCSPLLEMSRCRSPATTTST